MTARIVYQGDDGVAKVVIPSKSFLASGRSLDTLRGRPKDGRTERVVDSTDIPTDRTFRNAWELDEDDNNPPTKTNMVKAADIAKEMVRRFRKPKLEQLDVDYFKAEEAGDSARKQEVVDKKKTLRDATEDSRITDAPTESELKSAVETIQSEIEAM